MLSDEYALVWPRVPMEGMLSICVGIRDHGVVDDDDDDDDDDGDTTLRCVDAGLCVLSFVRRRSPAQKSAWMVQ